MSKNKPVEFTFHIEVGGDTSVGIPETCDTVKVTLEHGMNDDELNSELEQALKQTLADFYGADFKASVLTQKEFEAAQEKERKLEEQMERLEREVEEEERNRI